MFGGAVQAAGSMTRGNRGRGGFAGMAQTVAGPAEVEQPQKYYDDTRVDMQANANLNAINLASEQQAQQTQVNPRPTPPGRRNGMFRGIQSIYGRQYSRPMQRFNRMTGRDNFMNMGELAASGFERTKMPEQQGAFQRAGYMGGMASPFGFKRKPSGFKMKKK